VFSGHEEDLLLMQSSKKLVERVEFGGFGQVPKIRSVEDDVRLFIQRVDLIHRANAKPNAPQETSYLDLSLAAASSARAPARMPSMPRLPSWQAYSNMGWLLSVMGTDAVQGLVQMVGSVTVNS
jgi:hypothetical protein